MRSLFQLALAASVLVAGTTLATAGDAGQQAIGDLPVVAATAERAGLLVDAVSGLPSQASAIAIAAWLEQDLGLPPVIQVPHFAIVPGHHLVSLRLRGVASDRAGGIVAPAAYIVAVYDDETRTIYLSEGWTGTAADWSVVVHEMVHHLQNEARQQFGCAELREATAFAAQERWLEQFGTNLDREFGLDGLTLLVRTNCPY